MSAPEGHWSWQADADAVDLAGADRRTLWGRLWRYWLGPPLYFFNCRGPDGQPAHAKVLATIGFFVGLVWVCILLSWLVRLLALSTKMESTPPPGWLATLVLAFAALVFGAPYGLDGYKVWAKTRGGGTVDALEKTVVAEVQARRESVGGDHEPTD